MWLKITLSSFKETFNFSGYLNSYPYLLFLYVFHVLVSLVKIPQSCEQLHLFSPLPQTPSPQITQTYNGFPESVELDSKTHWLFSLIWAFKIAPNESQQAPAHPTLDIPLSPLISAPEKSPPLFYALHTLLF